MQMARKAKRWENWLQLRDPFSSSLLFSHLFFSRPSDSIFLLDLFSSRQLDDGFTVDPKYMKGRAQRIHCLFQAACCSHREIVGLDSLSSSFIMFFFIYFFINPHHKSILGKQRTARVKDRKRILDGKQVSSAKEVGIFFPPVRTASSSGLSP